MTDLISHLEIKKYIFLFSRTGIREIKLHLVKLWCSVKIAPFVFFLFLLTPTLGARGGTCPTRLHSSAESLT